MLIEAPPESAGTTDDYEYDSNCNIKIKKIGEINKICINGITKTVLEELGWKEKETSGRNSYIYEKGNKVIKIVKSDYFIRNYNYFDGEFCENAPKIIKKIKAVHELLKGHVPKLHHVKVCNYDGPRLFLLMEKAGIVNEKMENVKESQISNAANEMVNLGVFSTDIYTDNKVNTGNLAFTIYRNKLRVKFLDIDDITQYVFTDKVDDEQMYNLWWYVINVCLHRKVEPFSQMEYSRIKKSFVYFEDSFM